MKILLLAALALVAPPAHAQTATASRPANTIPAERGLAELERLLFEGPHAVTDDLDARAEDVTAYLERGGSGSDALDEAAVALLARQSGVLREPANWPRLLARLERAPLGPFTHARVARLAAEKRVDHLAPGELAAASRRDSFPDYLAEFRMLAPLDGPDPARRGEDLFASPGFEREHTGLRGERVRWRAARRSGLVSAIDPADWVEPVAGWALLAFEFESPVAGRGAVLVDTHGSNAQFSVAGLLATERAWNSTIGDPAWVASVNGGPRVRVDPLAAETPFETRLDAEFVRGTNRVLVWCALDAYPSFALRVLAPGVAALRARILQDELPRGSVLRAQLLRAEGQPAAALAEFAELSAAQPDSVTRRALHAFALAEAPYLPDVWRRARARPLFEQISGLQPRLDVEIQLARTLTGEDHEEDAIRRLEAARHLAPADPRPLLELTSVYPRLQMRFQARRALDEALALAPHSWFVLERAIDERRSSARHRAAAELREVEIEQLGAVANAESELADDLASSGYVERALACLRARDLRGGRPGQSLPIAQFLAARERWDEADRVYAELESAYPAWTAPPLGRAGLAHRRQDRAAEEQHLRTALARSPSDPAARAALRALLGSEPTETLLEEFRADRDAVFASYDAARWNDSVVRVLDSQVVRVFADGGWEALTHDIVQVKDLAGCESEGKQRLDGTVREIVTLHGPEREKLEPVELDGEYVMPGLKPGDFIERVWRSSAPAPSDGIVRLPNWRFASPSEPFHVSRWVVVVPRALFAQSPPLELRTRNFAGRHEVLERGDDLVHVFELRDAERVQVEPGMPPQSWILPSAEFGMRHELADVQRDLFAPARLATRVTPEVRAAAERVVAGVAGDSARARALHAFVRDTVRERNTNSAASASFTLLSERGNPAHLFAALLAAAGIDHELAWSRDVAPAADPDADEPFGGTEHWAGRLLVRVRPRDGAEAWCDLQSRDLPFGALLGNAPRAQVLTPRGAAELPDIPLEQRIGARVDVTLDIQSDKSALATLRLQTTGNASYDGKQRVRDLPASQLKAGIARAFGEILPGFDLETLDVEGLTDERELAFSGRGRVRSFLDETPDGLTAPQPLPALNMSATLAGGEGARVYPYFLGRDVVALGEVRVTMPEGMRLASAPPRTREEFAGGRFELAIEADGERTFVLRRKLLLPPFHVPAADYAAFAQFCAHVDELERVPLRFAR